MKIEPKTIERASGGLELHEGHIDSFCKVLKLKREKQCVYKLLVNVSLKESTQSTRGDLAKYLDKRVS